MASGACGLQATSNALATRQVPSNAKEFFFMVMGPSSKAEAGGTFCTVTAAIASCLREWNPTTLRRGWLFKYESRYGGLQPTLRHLHGTLTPTQRTRGQKQQRMQEREQRRESDANCKASSQASGHSTRANKANGQHRKNSRNQATEDSPGNAGSTVSLRRQFQLSIFRSSGAGLPFPVSSRSFRLSRKVTHLVLQCAVNSTASRQFRWPKRTML